MNLDWRNAVSWLFRPLMRAFLRALPYEDPWERISYRVPFARYGIGSRHDFSWYLEGESAVSIKSLEELQDWLLECRYVRDEDLFREPDFWQHPVTFEQLRAGDCEDHALWAWRKLIELGYDAELVSGRCLPWQPNVKGGERGHAWVLLRREGGLFLFETVAKDRAHMLRPLAAAREHYRPELGVTRDLTHFAFSGLIETIRERECGPRDRDSVRRSA